ncbi:MAG: hypothetical protein HY289_10530 [Planctomycetes bacterium]|nr:hypothetical protein [Planctomycetota bacterium]
MYAGFHPVELVHEAARIARIIHREIRIALETDRATALRTLTLHSGGSTKKALDIDVYAERRCVSEFRQRYGDKIVVFGEEGLPKDLSNVVQPGQLCVLVDMIDGTDLLEMGVPMWCSALVIFDPSASKPKIVGSVVAQATGEVYSANEVEDGAFVCRDLSPDLERQLPYQKLKGPSDVKRLAEKTTMCFYGQKGSSLLSVTSFDMFQKKIKEIEREPEASLRIHTLAGNPMMVKLVDRERDREDHAVVGRGIDAVFDIRGQHFHDVVPGAYIAKKAGAFLCSLDGAEISEATLARRLSKPAEKLCYVLGSTKDLAEELVGLFQYKPELQYKPKARVPKTGNYLCNICRTPPLRLEEGAEFPQCQTGHEDTPATWIPLSN